MQGASSTLLILDRSRIGDALLPLAAHSSAIYEALPNLFLGVLCDEAAYPIRPYKQRCWTDCLFPLVRPKLVKLLQAILPQRDFSDLATMRGHDQIAAFIC